MQKEQIIEFSLIDYYHQVRSKTEKICSPLVIEDYVIQSCEDVSPPKWHLAHTTWFFETFLLKPFNKNYRSFDPAFHQLFNSYYQSLGMPFTRGKRGILSRPTVAKIYEYRQYVDEHIKTILSASNRDLQSEIKSVLTLGLNHEQQHQELLLMDIKYNFFCDPYFPIYHQKKVSNSFNQSTPLTFSNVNGGIVKIGHQQNSFCFDNEMPSFEYLLQPFAIANRLVTNAEFLEFIEAGGYQQPSYWLSDGWDWILKTNTEAPFYWHKINAEWHLFTLSGLQTLKLDEPVAHISFFEADAYARFRDCRLPSEIEWEHFALMQNEDVTQGNFLESNYFHPSVMRHSKDKQIYGDLWEWTGSAYLPYPGYCVSNNAIGEYNGKFMNNQMVLRGGSCVTPKMHIRPTYRNFFQPDKRWQFSGIRLAKNV